MYASLSIYFFTIYKGYLTLSGLKTLTGAFALACCQFLGAYLLPRSSLSPHYNLHPEPVSVPGPDSVKQAVINHSTSAVNVPFNALFGWNNSMGEQSPDKMHPEVPASFKAL